MDMIELHNACYQMHMRGGGDVWRIFGQVYNHPSFPNGSDYSPSSPESFDEATMIVTSASGKSYKIMTIAGPREKFIEQLKKDVLNKGYEVH